MLVTANRLGLVSILRVVFYKALVRMRYHKVVRLATREPTVGQALTSVVVPASYEFEHFFFFGNELEVSLKKNKVDLLETLFLTNWFNGYVHSNDKFWYEIPDFCIEAGDIKGVWELSRWYWAVKIACDERMSINERRKLIEALAVLWMRQNPYLRGPNWKCGQEAALRLLHFILSMRILGCSPGDLTPPQELFILDHVKRIQPTLNYARGQKNNHWISEAVGLVIGGLWLSGHDSAEIYYRRGAREIELAIEALFNPDGSFAQSSFNYLRHAMTLLTLAKLEVSEARRDCSGFMSPKFQNALRFFNQFCDPLSDVTHNWGANDGSDPLALAERNFLDPSPYKAFYDFGFKAAVPSTENKVLNGIVNAYRGDLNKMAYFRKDLVRDVEDSALVGGFFEYPDGGVIFFRNSKYRVLIRLPVFKFKPSQDDVGHFDVILNGTSALLDAGTYSYFTDDKTFQYFQGVHSHNTIYSSAAPYSMTKLSRFIFGKWQKGEWQVTASNRLRLAFKNACGDEFERNFEFDSDRIIVNDRSSSCTADDIVSGITIDSESLRVSVNAGQVHIKVEDDKDSDNGFEIVSDVKPSIIKVPVSHCYGSKSERRRLLFPVKGQGLRFEVRI